MIFHKPQLQHLNPPSKPSAMLTKPQLSPTTMPLLMLLNQQLSSATQMPPLPGATHLLQPCSLQELLQYPLSLALDDEEDNVEVLTTISLSPTTAALSHVSLVPQRIRNKHQKCKTFHSKPRSYGPPTKKPTTTTGTRSNHLSMEKHPSPIANTNSMVFNSYLKKIMAEITNH